MASKTRWPLIISVIVVIVLAIGVRHRFAANGAFTPAAGKVSVRDTAVGTGTEAKFGSRVVAHYKLKLHGKGTELADTRKQPHHVPATYEIGRKQVLEGIEDATIGMRVGGVREALIPAHLAFGSAGVPPAVPPNSELDVEIELLDVKSDPK